MIKTPAEFDIALERVLGYLSDPPQPGGHEDAEFSRLMEDIAAYQAALPTPAPEHPAAPGLDRLQAELADFQRRHPDRAEGITERFGFGRNLDGS
ncbi:MAG: hypothetical protein WDM92_01765 [Caulobacteraceae bacterium]